MRAPTTILIVGVLLLTGACASGGGDTGDVSLSEAFSFTPAVDTTAAYFDITNNSEEDDVLLSATAEGFEDASLHNTVVEDGAASMMEQEDGIPLPAGETVTLEPGGLHVMLVGAETELVAGDELSISLEFENAGSVEVTSTVRDRSEDDPQPMNMDDMDEESMDEMEMDEMEMDGTEGEGG